MSGELVAQAQTALAESGSPIARLVEQKAQIQQAMKAVMVKDEHYGVIPGCKKPSLWQPGADTLCFLFRLRPEISLISAVERDDLISYDIKVTLWHIPTGEAWGEGVGAANSREKKYSAQSMDKVCPHCKKPAIIKGREDFGGGWLCFKKKDGCGAKFRDDDEAITSQAGEINIGTVWDLKNTILKMAAKRAKVAAVLTATAASDCFTQDLEDLIEQGAPEYRAPAKAEPPKAPAPPAPAPSVPGYQTSSLPNRPAQQGETAGQRVAPKPSGGISQNPPPAGQRPPSPSTTQKQTGATDDSPMFDSPERVALLHEIQILAVKNSPEGLGWHPKHAEAWLKKYFGQPRRLKLTLPQAKDAVSLLKARLRQPETYKALLERFHKDKRILTAETDE